MKRIDLTIVLIIITILAMIFNIGALVSGGYSSLFGFLASFGFVAIWALIYRYILKNRKNNLIVFSIMFWSLTLLTALIMLYVNITEVSISFIIPFLLLFLTPLHGLGFIGKSNNIITLIIILIIASIFILSGLIFLIKNKDKRL